MLEYDARLAAAADATTASTDSPTSAVSSKNPAAVARAREAYFRGNQQLFSGDTEAAVGSYRESLRIYPGYVAGYRGLGLAYAQQGKTSEALEAMRVYLRTVPGARDAALIRRRIDRLERSPAARLPAP